MILKTITVMGLVLGVVEIGFSIHISNLQIIGLENKENRGSR